MTVQRTYIISTVSESGVAVRKHAQVIGSSPHENAVVVVVSEQRAPLIVAGAPLQHVHMSVKLPILQRAASALLQVVVIQVPIEHGVISLHGHFFKRHRFFAVLGNVARLGSGIKIEGRGFHCRALAI